MMACTRTTGAALCEGGPLSIRLPALECKRLWKAWKLWIPAQICPWKLSHPYADSSECLNDSTVRARSLLANRAATGFISRIAPKS